MQEKLYRLAKLMSEQGLCSRREAEVYIQQGLVKVNGEVETNVAASFKRGINIALDNKAQQVQDEKVTLILNKPVGYVSSQPEKGYLPAIKLITQANNCSKKRLKPEHLKNLVVAGRLDIDSKGLLLFTQDGRVAKSIIGEETCIEKEYIVKVNGVITKEKIDKLCFGLSLDNQALKPAKIIQLNDYTLKFILQEGKKRQIRRMAEQVELKVTSLLRIRIGHIHLDRLKEGQWRFITF